MYTICVLILFPSFWIFMAMLSIESVVRGYHVYVDDWSPSVGDEFELDRHDRYTVAIKVIGDIVSHGGFQSGLRMLRSNVLRT